MKVKWTSRARRHRVGHGHALAVMAGSPTVDTRPNGEVEFSWLGYDDRGVELEIVAAITTDVRSGDEVLLVLHVMPTKLRTRQAKEE